MSEVKTGSETVTSSDPAEELVHLRALIVSVRGLPATAREGLERFGSIAKMARASDPDLLAVQGVGPAALAKLRAKLAPSQ